MIAFKIFWALDALAALVVIYFFFVGLGDGTVSERNMGLWIGILAAVAAILLGSIWLKNHSQMGLGFIILLIGALPVIFYMGYIIIAITGKGRWN